MPIQWFVDDDPPLLVVRGQGHLTVDDLIRYQEETSADPVTSGLDELLDLSACTSIEGDVEGAARVAAAAARARARRSPGKLAILAPGDLAFGLARMYQAMAEGVEPPREIRVTRTAEDAAGFLGLAALYRPGGG